jgi:hypothetical protein
MKPYVIKQGDYLKKLAFRMGFDADEVWNDPKNSELKEKRKDGDILAPGDILYVPEKPGKKLSFKKGADNAYKAKLPKLSVKVALAGPDGAPLKDEPYVIAGLGDEDVAGSTDGEGNVIFEAAVSVRAVKLTLTKRKQTFQVLVGDLDPVDEPSGARMRLSHLGLYGGSYADGPEPYASRDEAQLAAAITAFQKKQGLPATGKLDDATKAALVAAHGS